MAETPRNDKPYQLVGPPIHETWWDEQLQTTLSGWKVRARWLNTGAVITVRIPEADDLVTTTDTLVRFQGAQLDALAALSA